MKIQNNTKVPDEIILAVITAAGKAAHCPAKNTLVQVNASRGRFGCCHGTAYDVPAVRWGRGRNVIRCDGAFRIQLPEPVPLTHPWFKNGRLHPGQYDDLYCAELFFRVAAHEWGHIKDFHKGGRRTLPWSKRSARGRRPNHDNRPEEKRANRIERKALEEKDQHAEAILNLALALEKKTIQPQKNI